MRSINPCISPLFLEGSSHLLTYLKAGCDPGLGFSAALSSGRLPFSCARGASAAFPYPSRPSLECYSAWPLTNLLSLLGSHHLVTPLFLLQGTAPSWVQRLRHGRQWGTITFLSSSFSAKWTFTSNFSFLLHPSSCSLWLLSFLVASTCMLAVHPPPWTLWCFLLLYLSYPPGLRSWYPQKWHHIFKC